MRDRCKALWNNGKKVTIDETMVRYEGVYSPVRRYMPNKPETWGLKFGALQIP